MVQIVNKTTLKDVKNIHIRETHVTKDGRIVALDKWHHHKAIVIILPEKYKSKKDIESEKKADEMKRKVSEAEDKSKIFDKLAKLKTTHPKDVMTQIKCENPECKVHQTYSSKGIPLLTFDVSKGAKRSWVHFKCGDWETDKFEEKGYIICVWDEKQKKLVAPKVGGCDGKLSFFDEKVSLY